MKVSDTVDSLELSLLPAVLASSCCLTTPALGLLGLSLYEPFLYEYRWVFRFVALLLMVLSLLVYFRMKGIKTMTQAKENPSKVIFIVIQTFFFALVMYSFFLYFITPMLCDIVGIGSCNS